jgi:hypothetical protein
MRAFWLCIVALGLAVSPAMAGTGAGSDKDSAGNGAANTAAKAEPAPKGSPSSLEIENELQQMRDLLQTQSKQIEQQNEQLKEQQQQMQTLKDQLAANPTAASVTAAVASPANAGLVPATGVISAPTAAGAPSSPAAGAGDQGGSAEPTSWGFKGVTFTPIGFFAAESVWRQRGLGADINTPFNSLPMPGASQYNISEFNASGRQSRIGMLVQGKLSSVKIGGYYEADFLSAGTTSNDNQSNSYTLRQRQFWAQAAFDSGFTITGGQMWSLVTQTAKGVDPRSEVLPENIDSQYNVGFSWERQYGVRIAKNFNNKLWLAMSVEEPQITFKGAGTTVPFLFGQAGTGGGLYNPTANYSFNLTPDFVFKAAFEPGFGHYEVFGLISTFRDRIFPTGLAPYNSSTVGGGGGANAWFPFDSGHVNLGLHVLVGNGVGRYGSAQATPDVTIQPDGTFTTVRSYQGLGTLAFHYPKWDVYFHVGGEYGARTQDPTGTVGFGAIGFNNAGCWTESNPGSGGYAPTAVGTCANNIRDVIEGTAGVWYSFYSGPKGTVKFGLQFSHEAYNTWAGVGSTGTCTSTTNPSCAPSTNENMVFTSFRYYIP